MGLPPLCTVGAAEFLPPASGKIALFSIANELDVFSSPLPEVAADDVVQLVSGFSLGVIVDCATAVSTTNNPARMTATARIILISRDRKYLLQIHEVKRTLMAKVPFVYGFADSLGERQSPEGRKVLWT